jgi:hypothetical protein
VGWGAFANELSLDTASPRAESPSIQILEGKEKEQRHVCVARPC